MYKRQKLSITGAISEAPLSVLTTTFKKPVEFGINAIGNRFLPASTQGVLKRVGIATSGSLSNFFLEGDRKNANKKYWQGLLKARFLEAKEFKIVTGVDTIENCFFESITWNRDYTQGNSLIFDAVIKELRIVKSDFKPFTINSPFSQVNKNIGKVASEFISEDTPLFNKLTNTLSRIQRTTRGAVSDVSRFSQASSLNKVKTGLRFLGL